MLKNNETKRYKFYEIINILTKCPKKKLIYMKL